MHNQLDKFVRDKYQQREFEFDQAHWENAVGLIERDEKWKFWKNFGWASLAVVLFFAGGIGGYMLSTDSSGASVSSNTVASDLENTKDSPSATEMVAPLEIISTPSEAIAAQTTKNTNRIANQNEIAKLEFTNQNALNTSTSTSNSEQNEASEFSKITANSSTLIAAELESGVKLAEQSISKSISNLDAKREQPTQFTREAIQKPVLSPSAKVALIPAIGSLGLSPLEMAEHNFQIGNPNHPVIDGKPQKFLAGLALATLVSPSANSTSLGLNAGLTFKYKWRPQLSLNADLLYQYRPGDFAPIASSSIRQYSFGISGQENQLLPTSLHSVEFPLYLQYQTGKHFLEAGISASYLTGVRGGVASLDLLDSSTASPAKVDNKSWIENTGFNNFGTQLLMGYSFGLSQNASIGLRANYRLGDVQNVNALPLNVEPIKQTKLSFSLMAKWYIF